MTVCDQIRGARVGKHRQQHDRNPGQRRAQSRESYPSADMSYPDRKIFSSDHDHYAGENRSHADVTHRSISCCEKQDGRSQLASQESNYTGHDCDGQQ